MAKISVIIPTYNRALYLDAAIDSVRRQTHKDLEIIVSDNCSSDETPAVVARHSTDPRLRYFRNEINIGMVANWQRAVYEYASGEWFIILSDDDFFTDAFYLSKVDSLIKKHRQLVLVYAEGVVIEEQTGKKIELDLPFSGKVSGLDVFCSRGTIYPQDFMLCNVVFNRALSISMSAFSNPYNISCDSELFLMLCLRGNVGVIKEKVSAYRIHNGNLLGKLSSSADLLCGNIDFLVKPYIMAREFMKEERLSSFIKNSGLECFIRWHLLALSRLSISKYWMLHKKLTESMPEIMPEVYRSKNFKIKLLYNIFSIHKWFA